MGYVISEEEKKYLANYDYKKYDRPSVTTDIAVFTVVNEETGDIKRLPKRKLKVLLVQRGEYPHKNCYGLPGGFLRTEETLMECAKRELFEETHVSCDFLEEIGTASDIGRDLRGWIISVQYLALIDSSKLQIKGGDDASDAKWFDVSLNKMEDGSKYILELSCENEIFRSVVEEATGIHDAERQFRMVDQDEHIAFDHSVLIVGALTKLRAWIDTTQLGFSLVPERFTLTQLQQIYEAVKGEKLLTPAFRRKIQKYVVETEDYENDGHDAHRPAKLYNERIINKANKN